jgi:DNA-directed RNA polymerase subunit M/transcription elongation factor TFIIS
MKRLNPIRGNVSAIVRNVVQGTITKNLELESSHANYGRLLEMSEITRNCPNCGSWKVVKALRDDNFLTSFLKLGECMCLSCRNTWTEGKTEVA